VLCSPHLMEKLIPSFEKQIEEIISGVDATDKDNISKVGVKR